MTKGRPGAYICKSLRGHTGMSPLLLYHESLVHDSVLPRIVSVCETSGLIRQGGRPGIPAGEFQPASRPPEQQPHRMQRFH